MNLRRSGNWSGLKTKKYKTCWLISYPNQLPSEFTVSTQYKNACADQSTDPFALVSCPSSRADTADVIQRRMLGPGKHPGMFSQPPVTCDSGMSWLKINVFIFNIHWWIFLSFMFLIVLDFIFLIKGNVCNPTHLRNIIELCSMQSVKCFLLFALEVVPRSFILCPLIFILEIAKDSYIRHSPFLFPYLFYRSFL